MSSSPNSSSSSDARIAAATDPLDAMMDVRCPVDFVLGTSTLKVRDYGELAMDSIVRLRQPAGSDLEVRVSGVPMLRGEAVIVDDTVGLRVTRLLPPAPRESA